MGHLARQGAPGLAAREPDAAGGRVGHRPQPRSGSLGGPDTPRGSSLVLLQQVVDPRGGRAGLGQHRDRVEVRLQRPRGREVLGGHRGQHLPAPQRLPRPRQRHVVLDLERESHHRRDPRVGHVVRRARQVDHRAGAGGVPAAEQHRLRRGRRRGRTRPRGGRAGAGSGAGRGAWAPVPPAARSCTAPLRVASPPGRVASVGDRTPLETPAIHPHAEGPGHAPDLPSRPLRQHPCDPRRALPPHGRAGRAQRGRLRRDPPRGARRGRRAQPRRGRGRRRALPRARGGRRRPRAGRLRGPGQGRAPLRPGGLGGPAHLRGADDPRRGAAPLPRPGLGRAAAATGPGPAARPRAAGHRAGPAAGP